MPNLKEIRQRIQSVASVTQITGAMKMVSVAKLKKAKDTLSRIQPYVDKIEDLLTTLSPLNDLRDISRYFQEAHHKPKLIIVVGSNRGLCGAFNVSLTRKIISRMSDPSGLPVPLLLTIGKKVKEALSTYFPIYQDHSGIILDSISYTQVSLLCDALIHCFLGGDFHSIEIVYNNFKNTAAQLLVTEKILPITFPEDILDDFKFDSLMEPSKIAIVNNLIPKRVKVRLFNAILKSSVAEQGARVNAMHKATDNASALKNELLHTYNKARQGAITGEILEIVGGC